MIVVCMPPPVIPWQKRATSKWKYVSPKKINIQNAEAGIVRNIIARLQPIQLVSIPNKKVPETTPLLHKVFAFDYAQHIHYHYYLVCRRMRWWSYDDFDVEKIAHKMQWKHSLCNAKIHCFFTLSIPIARVIMVQFSTEYLRIIELSMTGSTMHSYILWMWRERETMYYYIINYGKKHVEIGFAIVHTPCPKKMMFAAKAAKYWFERFCQLYWPVCVTLSLISPKTLCHACFNANWIRTAFAVNVNYIKWCKRLLFVIQIIDANELALRFSLNRWLQAR